MRNHPIRLVYITILILLWVPDPIFAASVHKANVEVELVSDVSSISPGQRFQIGLRMAMDEGWHTYWRNSGDSGLATNIDWVLPKGFGAGDINWPYPKRFDYEHGLTGYGYDGEVILLTQIWAPDDLPTGESIEIQAEARWLSCKEICVPGAALLTIPFSTSAEAPQKDGYMDKKFQDEIRHWPVVSDQWKLTAEEAEDMFKIKFIPQDPSVPPISNIVFYPYRNDIINHSSGQEFKKLFGGGYELDVKKTVLLDTKLEKIIGIFVSPEGWGTPDGERALFYDVPVE